MFLPPLAFLYRSSSLLAHALLSSLVFLLLYYKTRSKVDILGILSKLRADRPALLETAAQYIFVFKAATLYSMAISAEPAPPAYVPTPKHDDQNEDDPPEFNGGNAKLNSPPTAKPSAEIMGRGVLVWKREILSHNFSQPVPLSAHYSQTFSCENCNSPLVGLFSLSFYHPSFSHFFILLARLFIASLCLFISYMFTSCF